MMSFYISLHYLGNKIKDHFGNGSRLNVNIKYITETKPLGTAGSIGLIKEKFKEPLIVCNADVISNLSVELNDHEAAKLVISIAESHVKTSDDMLTIGYCFSYTDQNTMRKYFNKAKEIAETGEQLFNIGMKYNDELEDIKTAKTICKEALTKFTSDEEEDKKYYENMFKEVYG